MVSLFNIYIINEFIDIKSGFNYNSDDYENINLGFDNKSNVKKRNIKTEGAL